MKNFINIIIKLLGLIWLWNITVVAAKENLAIKPEVQNFISYMNSKHNFSLSELNKLFANYMPNQEVLNKISNPSEKLPWGKYKQLLISKPRIAKGKEFLIKYHDILLQAEQTYGVPKELIVAILGIESFYGEKAGNLPVIGSLATLSFNYPPRSKFFTQELEQFLLLTKEERLDPTQIKGSYAGAFSPAQFIPSSYRNYAVDFAKIGSKDLNHMHNAIGSIANYLFKHGWNKQQPIAKLVTISNKNKNYVKYLEQNLSAPQPKYALNILKVAGIKCDDQELLSLSSKAALMEFMIDLEKNQKEYWLGFNNFYVITRYNHSANYAMAVYQLALALNEELIS